jgi:hypothetical protein
VRRYKASFHDGGYGSMGYVAIELRLDTNVFGCGRRMTEARKKLGRVLTNDKLTGGMPQPS